MSFVTVIFLYRLDTCKCIPWKTWLGPLGLTCILFAKTTLTQSPVELVVLYTSRYTSRPYIPLLFAVLMRNRYTKWQRYRTWRFSKLGRTCPSKKCCRRVLLVRELFHIWRKWTVTVAAGPDNQIYRLIAAWRSDLAIVNFGEGK